MADEFVGNAQFGEFVKRMDERFDRVDERFSQMNKLVDERFDRVDERFGQMNKLFDERFAQMNRLADERFTHMSQLADQRHDSINKRLADAEKAREQNLVHVDQRFDNLEKRMDFQNRMTLAVSMTVGGGILIGLVKYLFFSS